MRHNSGDTKHQMLIGKKTITVTVKYQPVLDCFDATAVAPNGTKIAVAGSTEDEAVRFARQELQRNS